MRAKTILVESLTTLDIHHADAVLYKVPPNTRSKWVLAFVSNSGGSTVSDVAIEIDAGTEHITVMGSKSLSAGDYLRLEQDGGYVMLEAGYEIRGSSGSTGVSCILTVEETMGTVTING